MGLQRHLKNSTALPRANNSAAAPDKRQTGPVRKFKPNLTQIKRYKFWEALKHEEDSISTKLWDFCERKKKTGGSEKTVEERMSEMDSFNLVTIILSRFSS